MANALNDSLDKAEAADGNADSAALLEVLGAAMLEAETLADGGDPDEDPMLVIRRGEDSRYKAISDAFRSDHAAAELERQLGMPRQRLVGTEEAAQLTALITSR
jgi:hypothetical protein